MAEESTSAEKAEAEEELYEQSRIQPWTIYLIAGVIAVGLLIGFKLVGRVVEREADPNKRLPYISRLEKDIQVTNSKGEAIWLGDEVKGKVYIVSYLYTDCPNGCAGIALEMEEVRKEFAEEEDFRLASFTLDANKDTPEKLAAFREAHQFDAANWSFYTGDQEKIAGYMTRYFRFMKPRAKKPEEQKQGPNDLWDHDMRIALIDRDAHVRGFYDVWNSDADTASIYREKLRKDIRRLLDKSDD